MATLFTTQTPTGSDANAAYTLGTRFSIDVAGYSLTAVRYWRPDTSSDGVVRTVGVWNDATQTLLGSGSRTQTSADPVGWVTVTLTTPVPLTASTGYTVGFTVAAGRRWAVTPGFFNTAYTNLPLRAPVAAGRYFAYPGALGAITYPALTFEGGAYFADPIVEAGGTTHPITTTSASTSSGSVTITSRRAIAAASAAVTAAVVALTADRPVSASSSATSTGGVTASASHPITLTSDAASGGVLGLAAGLAIEASAHSTSAASVSLISTVTSHPFGVASHAHSAAEIHPTAAYLTSVASHATSGGFVRPTGDVITGTPTSRTLTIAAESRSFTVPAQSRVLVVPRESRTLEVQ